MPQLQAMRHNTLDAWLGWLEQRHPREIDLGLTRIRAVAERLGLLQPKARVLTVAGTNGKGSCVAVSAYLLRRAGYRVGIFTSPHLQHYCRSEEQTSELQSRRPPHSVPTRRSSDLSAIPGRSIWA